MSDVADFQRDGVLVSSAFIDSDVLKPHIEQMIRAVSQCANEINCSEQDYLTSASRWMSPSPVTAPFLGLVNSILKPKLECLLNCTLKLVKINIICKNRYAANPVPCHQDIAYQRKTPYKFSCWLSLSDINDEDGPLMCLPKSHLKPIETAVDFWDINFVDKNSRSREWLAYALRLSVKIGDAILFDSKTLHGSAKNISGKARYALVTRWKLFDDEVNVQIPNVMPGKFGMWTCHERTINIIQQLLEYHNITPSKDFIHLLDQVDALIPTFIWVKNPMKARQSIRQVKILHMAAEKHNAGDAQGWIYKKMWFNFLNQIEPIIMLDKVTANEYK